MAVFKNDAKRRMTDQIIPPPALFRPTCLSLERIPSPRLRRDTLGFLLHCQTYGDVVKLPDGACSRTALAATRRRHVCAEPSGRRKHVLVGNQDNYRKAPVAPAESRIFGQGVLHTEGEIHHHQRRLVLPFFHGSHVTAYTDLIHEQDS